VVYRITVRNYHLVLHWFRFALVAKQVRLLRGVIAYLSGLVGFSDIRGFHIQVPLQEPLTH